MRFLNQFRGIATFCVVVTVFVQTLTTVLATVSSLQADLAGWFLSVQWACLGLLALDGVVRAVWTPRRRLDYGNAKLRSHLRYLFTPFAVFDLLAVLPLWWTLRHPSTSALQPLWQLLPLLKLGRHSPAIATLGQVVYRERRALVASGTIMLTLLLFLSAIMYAVEREGQPEAFGSIPATMWWGIATLTTVGYGDVVPHSPLGRVIGAFVTVLGFGMFGLPAGILATGFAEEMKRQQFVSTWNLVAKVPFFDHLPAARIADIAGQLKSRHAEKGETIVREGDQADCMYFIAEGRIDIDLGTKTVQLHQGDFFGEMALIQQAPRNATVRAASKCHLLSLNIADFNRILEANDDLRQAVHEVVRQRAQVRRAASVAIALDDGDTR